MRDKNQDRQKGQQQTNERGSSNRGYEQTGTSQQQQQRGLQSGQDRSDRPGLSEQRESGSVERGKLSEPGSI